MKPGLYSLSVIWADNLFFGYADPDNYYNNRDYNRYYNRIPGVVSAFEYQL